MPLLGQRSDYVQSYPQHYEMNQCAGRHRGRVFAAKYYSTVQLLPNQHHIGPLVPATARWSHSKQVSSARMMVFTRSMAWELFEAQCPSILMNTQLGAEHRRLKRACSAG
jgi:hypothetical protein